MDEASTEIPVSAVVEITKGGVQRNLFDDMFQLDETKTQGNWEEINKAYEYNKFTLLSEQPAAPRIANPSDTNVYYYIDSNDEYQTKLYYSHAEQRWRYYYTGNWNIFLVANDRHYYNTGDNWRTEPIIVKAGNEKETKPNGNQKISADKLDSINVDFLRDINFSEVFDTWNWDITYPLQNNVTVDTYQPAGYPTNLRLHASIKFDGVYTTRNDTATLESLKEIYQRDFDTQKSTDADPLYVQIESEPMVTKLGFKNLKLMSSVRQIIININETNMQVGDDSKVHNYAKRPWVIFYNGPEYNRTGDSDDEARRKSQPVILNLNADFRGILFAPYSPVIIIGNGKKFEGFVIAESFKKLMTASEFGSYTEFTNSNGRRFFALRENTLDISQVPLTDTSTSTATKFILRSSDERIVEVSKSDLIFLHEKDEVGISGTLNTSINNLFDGDKYDTDTYGESRKETGTNKYAGAYVLKDNLYDGDENFHGISTTEYYSTESPLPTGKEALPTGYQLWSLYKYPDTSTKYYILHRQGFDNKAEDNILLWLSNWRVVYNNEGHKYLLRINSRLKVTDANGKVAYVDTGKAKDKYIKLQNGDDTRFVEVGGDQEYFVERALEVSEPVKDKDGNILEEGTIINPTIIVDQHGSLKFSDFNSTTTYDKCPYDDKDGYKPEDFGLDSFNSFYSRCGALPKRKEYKSLDLWETKGDLYHYRDMFFTTKRAKETF